MRLYTPLRTYIKVINVNAYVYSSYIRSFNCSQAEAHFLEDNVHRKSQHESSNKCTHKMHLSIQFNLEWIGAAQHVFDAPPHTLQKQQKFVTFYIRFGGDQKCAVVAVRRKRASSGEVTQPEQSESNIMGRAAVANTTVMNCVLSLLCTALMRGGILFYYCACSLCEPYSRARNGRAHSYRNTQYRTSARSLYVGKKTKLVHAMTTRSRLRL